MSFEGFPDEAFAFYEGLIADNSKAYWTDHRATYDRCVKAPMQALLAELEPEFGAATFFRPYRDVRFSKDKTPYKEHAGAVVTDDAAGRSALYVQVGADGIYVGGGYYRTATDQARRLRDAIAEDRTGPQLVRLLDALTEAGFEVNGEQLKRLPKEYADDHPRVELLRSKSLFAGRALPPGGWMHTAECGQRIVASWRSLQPLGEWLERHVGASRTETARRRP